MCTGKVQAAATTVMQALQQQATIVATTIIKQKGRGAGLGKVYRELFQVECSSVPAGVFATRFPNLSLN